MGMSILSYCLWFHFSLRECPKGGKQQNVIKFLSIIKILMLPFLNIANLYCVHIFIGNWSYGFPEMINAWFTLITSVECVRF